jgi:4-hydroxythreonine-4-phosphate dehydrogenase
MRPNQPPLALTMGEPAGIGPDITVKAWLGRSGRRLPPFYCLADPAALDARARLIGAPVAIMEVAPDGAAAVFDRALPVVPLAARVKARAGTPDPQDAPAVIEAIRRAVGDVRAGRAAAVVTNPLSKRAVQAAGFPHPGHTEFLGELAAAWGEGPRRAVMMLAGPELRTVPVTVHVPLREVPGLLSEKLIVEVGRIVAADLARYFAIAVPRLAVAGLNPHAGEGGMLGEEDERIVRPAVAALVVAGVDAFGPVAADTLFRAEARGGYDAALCMYHDQALIPVKTVAFAETVNVTLGLPFIRTSPDHGTAFDIAGTGKADATNLMAALRLAATMADRERAR